MLSRVLYLSLPTFIFLSVFFVSEAAYASNLLGHWKFDEGSGSTALDSSGEGNHGTLVGDATYTTEKPPSISFPDPYSLSLDGNGDGVTTPLSLNNFAEFTLAGWAYPRTASAGEGWFGANNVFEFFFGSGTQLNCWTGINAFVSWSFAGDADFLNNWHHITCLGTGTSVILYVDGEEVARQNHGFTDNYGSGDNFSIGIGVQDGGTTGPFDGYIDDVRVYNRALTPEEMEGLGTGESGPTNTPVIVATSPADNATNVPVNANLSFTFGTTSMATSTGSISIYQASDDELFQSVDINDSNITRSVSATATTFTLDLSENLEEGVEYYVHIASSTFRDAANTYYAGTAASTTWSFTVIDETAPTPTDVSASTTNIGATITWSTAEQASSRVVYGLTLSYGTHTNETDTSPRVTSHDVELTGLLSCTTYHYAVVSRDAAGNSATSSDETFTTSGCEYDEEPTAATSTVITSSAGGSTSIADGDKTFTVTAPANSTATSSSFVIQVKAVPSESVLSSIGRPNAAPQDVGVTVFDVTAIIDGDTILDSFDAEITIEYEYEEGDVDGLKESSLWLYHYTNGAWVALNDCSLDVNANTISCTTPSFSIFGLFGTEAEVTSSNGGGATRVGVRKSAHTPVVPAVATTTPVQDSASSTPISVLVRDLYLDDEGVDVKALQTLLIAQGYSIPPGATGYFAGYTKAALSQYQMKHGVNPTIGYFGPITRAQMKAAGLTGLWW